MVSIHIERHKLKIVNEGVFFFEQVKKEESKTKREKNRNIDYVKDLL